MEIKGAFLLFSLFVAFISADKDVSVCVDEYRTCGRIAPPLGNNFILKAEKVDLIAKQTSYYEKHFDFTNQRAYVMYLQNGIESRGIYDYARQKLYSYQINNPEVGPEDDLLSQITCEAQSLSELRSNPFGSIQSSVDFDAPVRMDTAYKALYYGGPYKFAYVEGDELAETTFKERGYESDKYRGCVYQKTGMKHETVQVNMTFAGSNTELYSQLTDTILIRIDEEGTVQFEDQNMSQPLSERTTVIFFDNDPTFDENLFKIPPRIYCERDSTDHKSFEDYQSTFSVQIQETVSIRDPKGNMIKGGIEEFKKLWVNYERNIARMEFQPELNTVMFLKMFERLDVVGRVNAVFDFTTDIVYATDIATGLCTFFQIPKDDMTVSKGGGDGVAKLATFYEIFEIQDMTWFYKGEYTARGIKSDVWYTEEDSDEYRAQREIYIAKDGWHVVNRGSATYKVPVRLIKTNETVIDKQNVQEISEAEYFSFDFEEMPLTVFNLGGCSNHHWKKTFELRLVGENEIIQANYHQFVNEARKRLTDYSGIQTILRVEDVEMQFFDLKLMTLIFSFLDLPEMSAGEYLPEGLVTVEDAENALRDIVDAYNFEIVLVVDEKSHIVKAVPKSLEELKPDSGKQRKFSNEDLKMVEEYTKPAPVKATRSPVKERMLRREQRLKKEARNDKNEDGLDAGAVAGIGIAMGIVGIVLGVMAVILFMKYRTKNDGEAIQFALQDRKS